MDSSIEQEHFIRIVAGHLGVSESAVRQEVGKVRKAPAEGPVVEETSSISDIGENLSQLERTFGMLLFYFSAQDGSTSGREKDPAVRARLTELLGEARVGELETQLGPHAEMLRFKFESEVGAHTDEATIAGDMFKQIEIAVIEEQMAASRGDVRRISELARRKHELQKDSAK